MWAAVSFISLQSLLKDLAFGGPKYYRGIMRARLLPAPCPRHRLSAYHPATSGMSQQDKGSQGCSDGECVMGTYHTRLRLSGSSSWRSVPSQHPYGSLLPEGAMPEAGCHRDCTCLRLAEVPTCCGSDRFPPCFQTGCSSCSAGLLRLGVPSRGYPSLQHSPAREGRGRSARTATPAADSKCGGLGSTKYEDPARDTASRL